MSRRTDPRFTARQGRYLAFIHAYSKLNRRPPAQADLQSYFGVSAPTIHQMLLRLEADGLLERIPGVARSLRLLVAPPELPPLE